MLRLLRLSGVIVSLVLSHHQIVGSMYQTLTDSLSSLTSRTQAAEYVIYAYLNEDDFTHQESWKRVKTGTNLEEMKRDAYDLFQTQDYKKVEIQKKYFDEKKGHQRVTTFYVLENKKPTDYFTIISGILMIIALLGLFYLKL